MFTKKQHYIKRIVDIIFSFFGLIFLTIPILLLILISSFSLNNFGLYRQKRVGQNSMLFTIYKIKTMRDPGFSKDSKLKLLDKYGITLKGDKRVTFVGKFLRKYKLDELPQLYNVLVGDMSLVGPRPDIIGYADKLEGKDRIILSVKPGITGPATLAFRNEESLLSKQVDPLAYNNEVLWPQKVAMNVLYVKNWSFKKDMIYIYQTFFN